MAKFVWTIGFGNVTVSPPNVGVQRRCFVVPQQEQHRNARHRQVVAVAHLHQGATRRPRLEDVDAVLPFEHIDSQIRLLAVARSQQSLALRNLSLSQATLTTPPPPLVVSQLSGLHRPDRLSLYNPVTHRAGRGAAPLSVGQLVVADVGIELHCAEPAVAVNDPVDGVALPPGFSTKVVGHNDSVLAVLHERIAAHGLASQGYQPHFCRGRVSGRLDAALTLPSQHQR